jgi:hypothetical protein
LDGAIFCLLSRFDDSVASVDDPVQEQTGIFLVREVEIVSAPHFLGGGPKLNTFAASNMVFLRWCQTGMNFKATSLRLHVVLYDVV